MKSFKPWLLLLLVFVAGAGVGVVGTRIVVRRVIQRIAAHPDLVRERIERQLDRTLDLTGDQRTHVHRALAEAHDRIQGLRREFQPRFLGIVENTETNIAAALNPGQRARFEKWIREREFLWKPSAPDRP